MMPQGGRCRGHPAAVRLVRGAAVPGGSRRRTDPADAARGKGAPERLSGICRIREAHVAPHPRHVVRPAATTPQPRFSACASQPSDDADRDRADDEHCGNVSQIA